MILYCIKYKFLPNERCLVVFLPAAIVTRSITFVGCQESQAAAGGSSSADRTDGLDNPGFMLAKLKDSVMLELCSKTGSYIYNTTKLSIQT